VRTGIVIKEVVLRDIPAPAEYAKGLEGLLLKEQENERLNIVLSEKKMVLTAGRGGGAEGPSIKGSGGAGAWFFGWGFFSIGGLVAKAQADAMQHTLR